MTALWAVLGIVFIIAGLVCNILILKDAFEDEIWKGIVSILCGLYFLYYALFEYEADNKWIIVIVSLAGTTGGSFFLSKAGF